jgi:hypothetical protein
MVSSVRWRVVCAEFECVWYLKYDLYIYFVAGIVGTREVCSTRLSAGAPHGRAWVSLVVNGGMPFAPQVLFSHCLPPFGLSLILLNLKFSASRSREFAVTMDKPGGLVSGDKER